MLFEWANPRTTLVMVRTPNHQLIDFLANSVVWMVLWNTGLLTVLGQPVIHTHRFTTYRFVRLEYKFIPCGGISMVWRPARDPPVN